MSLVAVDKFGVAEKVFDKDNVCLQQIIIRIPLPKTWYVGFFPLNIFHFFSLRRLSL